MNPAIWISIYLPIFVLLFVILPAQRRHQIMSNLIKRKKGEKIMSNELIIGFIGKTCTISLGAYVTAFKKVKIVEVVDNWIKIEKNNKIDLVNIDFIQNIKIIE